MTTERYTDYMYNLIDRVMREIGPRRSCGDEEKQLGRLFAREIEPACERVETEIFTCSPTAFMGAFPYLVAAYVISVVLYFFLPPAALGLSLAASAVMFLEVVRYREFTDPLYPKREGENVAGFVKPRGEVRKRVYVSAHLDSAYEFKIWYWFKSLGGVVTGIGFFAVFLLIAFSLARTIAEPTGVPRTGAFWVLGYILIGFSPLVISFAFWHTGMVVPGAADNAAGISVLAGLGRYLKDAVEDGDFYPENTEVVLLALSSEEAGLRGAKRYAARHLEELKSLPAYAVFLDNICDERHFIVMKREVFMSARMDPYLVELARRSAEDCGFVVKVGVVPIGASDGSAFAQAGIPSVSMIMMDNTKTAPNYHTRLDTIEYVRREALTTALQTVIEMIKRIDANGVDANGARHRLA